MTDHSTRPPAAPVGRYRGAVARSLHRAGIASRRLGSRFDHYTLHAFNPAPPLRGRWYRSRP